MEDKEENIQIHLAGENKEENPENLEENSQDSQQNHLQEENKKENPENSEETTQETEEGCKLEQNHLLENCTMEERSEEGRETNVVLTQTQNRVSDAEKGGETKVEKQQVRSSQKPKVVPKQNQKPKLTVPQPFSLATETRMSRERRGGLDKSSPNLSKSATSKILMQSSMRIERSTDLKLATTASKSTFRGTERMEKRIESGNQMKEKNHEKEAEITKKSHSIVKKEELEAMKLKKSSTFKATPLPSFYHQKAPPPMPELKKIPSTRPRSPHLGHHRSKSMFESGIDKIETIEKSTPKKISSSAKETMVFESGKDKIETIEKSAPKKIRSSAKETINKLLRGPWKATTTRRKESMKAGMS
ncbi:uncharacterized protein LOC143879244 [Tasmannia lanceolata]|uniref:uncharacterized protein LOC143879244 n=1 Tax=Tasmannia lanceolata TaxID=3420 RepID=UPI004063A083